MALIQLSIFPLDDSVKEIISVIKDVYGKDDSDLEIENCLSEIFDELKDDLYILIEYPYVDKVYRDSYYSYFSSKHNEYFRDCIRISFFKDEIKLDHFRNLDGEKHLQANYLGYLVLRPTFPSIIGRSLISKDAFLNSDFVICNFNGNVSINGVKLDVSGFPHCSQDAESISCAETTIWSLMEYFGNRYPDYKPTLPSNIINILSKFSKQRMLPSNGLTVDQISFALKEFGFGTQIYSSGADAYDNEIENIISYYIESGIPVIAALENASIAHAIVIIGHEVDSNPDFGKTAKRKLSYNDEDIEYFDYTDIQKKYVVNDDNLPPYQLVSLSNPVEHYDAGSDFDGCKIESIVVPLYKKIYLEVIKAKQLILAIASDKNVGFKFGKGFVFRFFLTSSRSFKQHIARLKDLDETVKDYIILSKMPKFIWCVEFYEQADFGNKTASGLIVIDATEANEIWMDSLILASYPDRLLIKIDEEFVSLPNSLKIYTRFKNNLD